MVNGALLNTVPHWPLVLGQTALVNGLPAPLGWVGSENPGPGPPFQKGPPHRVVEGCRGSKMAHRERVLRTRPRNRDFRGFCVFRGPTSISRAWQKRFVQKRPPLC